MALQRMDNVGIVVESLDAAISSFAELGLELEGRAMIELGDDGTATAAAAYRHIVGAIASGNDGKEVERMGDSAIRLPSPSRTSTPFAEYARAVGVEG